MLRYSKSGIPSFSCSEKKGDVVYPQSGQEFLTMGVLPQFDCEDLETDWSITPEFQKRSREDAMRWREVQASMARSSCVVEIESYAGEGWEDIAPVRTHDLTWEHGTSPKTRAQEMVDDDETWDNDGTTDHLSQCSGSDYQNCLEEDTDHDESDSRSERVEFATPVTTNSTPGEAATPSMVRRVLSREQTPVNEQLYSSVGIWDSEQLLFKKSWSV